MLSEKKLEQFGLTDKEARVYKSLLELGQATAADIAIKSGIKRATTYVMLEALISKGLISKIDKANKTFFLIEEPYSLLKNLYLQKDDLDVQIENAKQIIPDLQTVYNLSRQKSQVRLLEGREGVRILQKDIMRSKIKHFDNISNINLALEAYPVSPGDHRQDFYKKDWSGRVIFAYDESKPIPELKGMSGEERRFIAQSKMPVCSDIMIYGNKVSIITLQRSLIGVIIENEDIATSMKTLFELAWISAKEIDKK